MKKRNYRLFFVMLISVSLLSHASFALPITLHDTDLTDVELDKLKKTYAEIEYEKLQKNFSDVDQSDEIETNNKQKIDYIDDSEYIQTEENINKNRNIDLSVTNIDDNYNYRVINKNNPDLNANDYEKVAFENYSELDNLGRCGAAFALLGIETMPKDGEERESLSQIKPTGWQIKKYDIVDGKYIYNRCHLIGWQLSAENANIKNLFIGTRYLNVKGMLPFENQIANYIKTTNNHVLYRVTPIFEGNNLVASRVHLEALSYEDNGKSLKFNVLLENYQPGIHIDYASGETYEVISTNSTLYNFNDVYKKVA